MADNAGGSPPASNWFMSLPRARKSTTVLDTPYTSSGSGNGSSMKTGNVHFPAYATMRRSRPSSGRVSLAAGNRNSLYGELHPHSRRSASGTVLVGDIERRQLHRQSVEPPTPVKRRRAQILDAQLKAAIGERAKLQTVVDKLEREVAFLEQAARDHGFIESDEDFVQVQLQKLQDDLTSAHIRVKSTRARSSTVSVAASRPSTVAVDRNNIQVLNQAGTFLTADDDDGSCSLRSIASQNSRSSPRPATLLSFQTPPASPTPESRNNNSTTNTTTTTTTTNSGSMTLPRHSSSPLVDSEVGHSATVSHAVASRVRRSHRRSNSRVVSLRAAFEPPTSADLVGEGRNRTRGSGSGGGDDDDGRDGEGMGGKGEIESREEREDRERRAQFDYYTPYLELTQQLRRLETVCDQLGANYAHHEEMATSHAESLRKGEAREDELLKDIHELREELDAIQDEATLLRETAAQREAEVGLEVSTLTDEFNADLRRLYALEDLLGRPRSGTLGTAVGVGTT